MARIGEVIDGKYEILREIGRGGMSVVYLAMDKRLNKQWAIKEFRKDKDDAGKQVALKALLDEANLMKRLDHPTLPRIVDIIDDNTTVYIVMDYIEGESLNKVLDAYGAQPQEAVIEWAKQLSEVLDYLHTQSPPVIYRDMKPANIMLKPDGTVRLIDFGIAREYKEGKEGDTEAIGTRGYAAPEQFGGKGQTDARTDIYSLGVTLYHLVTGKNPAEPPYEIYPIRHWNPSLSTGLEWLIQKCTQLNPNDRYQSCAEVSYVLENLDKFELAYKRKRKNRINLFFISVIMTVVFAGFGGLGILQKSLQTDNKYDAAMEQNNFVEAVLYHPEREEPYQGVLEYYTGNYQNQKKFSSKEIGDLYAVFTHVESLQDTGSYIQLCYDVGKLIYSSYKGENDADNLKESSKYFLKALSANENASEKDQLKAVELNRCKAYYLLSLIYDKQNSIKDGESYSLPQSTLDMLTEEQFSQNFNMEIKNGRVENPRKEAWSAIQKLTDVLTDNSTDIDSSVKLESYRRIAYLLESYYSEFGAFLKEMSSEDQFISLCGRISNSIYYLENLSEDDIKTKDVALKSLTNAKLKMNTWLQSVSKKGEI